MSGLYQRIDNCGWTPLHLATNNNHKGCTPLHLASSIFGNVSCVQLLLEAGADYQIQDNDTTESIKALLLNYQDLSLIKEPE
jgi:ankyrin repeat protein